MSGRTSEDMARIISPEASVSVDTVLIEVASLQKRLAETDAQLADSEMQLNAAKAESQRLERENHELRQILLALEKGDTSRESPGGAGDAAGADFSRSELSFTAECSASVLPAKLPARVRVRDGVLEVSLVASIPCASVLQLFRLEGGEVIPVHLRAPSTNGVSRPSSAGPGGAAAHCRDAQAPEEEPSSRISSALPPPAPRPARSISMPAPAPGPPVARRSPPAVRSSTDAGPSSFPLPSFPQPSAATGGFAASLDAKLGAVGVQWPSARDDGRASRAGSDDARQDQGPSADVSVQVLWSPDPMDCPGPSESGMPRPPHKLVLETDAAGAMFVEEQLRAWIPSDDANAEADDGVGAETLSLENGSEGGDKPDGPPACLGRERGCIMTDDHVRLLHKALPARVRLRTWTLLYGSKRDGISLQTLYRRAAGRAPTLLVVSDTSGGAFGAFTNEAWKVGPKYRGTGECFVFRLAPEFRLYRWSKLNSFFMLGQPDSIAVGAGGHFALWLDEDLHRGTSGDCDTFRSKTLSTSADFEIVYVELWGFE